MTTPSMRVQRAYSFGGRNALQNRDGNIMKVSATKMDVAMDTPNSMLRTLPLCPEIGTLIQHGTHDAVRYSTAELTFKM